MILTLVGYRGSGKSTVGKALAKRLDCECIDTDDVVQQSAGRTIAQIFETDGEEQFRKLETEVLQQLGQQKDLVIAAGGGAILAEENRRLMSSAGPVVWLTAPADVLAARIVADAESVTQRPSLTGKSIAEEVAEVLQARLPLYQAAADFQVDVSQADPVEIAGKIFQWLSRSGT